MKKLTHKKITVLDYPVTFSFETDVELPPFKYDADNKGYKVRTKLVQQELKKIKYGSPHVPSDFVVEVVTETEDGETWELGS